MQTCGVNPHAQAASRLCPAPNSLLGFSSVPSCPQWGAAVHRGSEAPKWEAVVQPDSRSLEADRGGASRGS